MSPNAFKPSISTPPSKTTEAGFSMAEVLVTCLVLLVLTAIAVPTYLSVKSNSQFNELVSSTRSLSQAIETYKLNNGGKAPLLGSAEWPVLHEGPINTTPGLQANKRHYMRSNPSALLKSGAIQTNAVPNATTFSLAASGEAAPGTEGYLRYYTTPDQKQYSFLVHTEQDGSDACYIGAPVQNTSSGGAQIKPC